MFSSIPWQQYLLTVGILSGLYYLVVVLLYCRKDIKHLLKGKTNRTGLPADQPIPPQVSIMGAASLEAAPSLSCAASILAAPQPLGFPEEETEEDEVNAMLQELKPLLDLATEADADKEELLPLLRLVTARHSPALQDHHRKALAEFLLRQDRFPFTLTPDDLQYLWSASPAAQ